MNTKKKYTTRGWYRGCERYETLRYDDGTFVIQQTEEKSSSNPVHNSPRSTETCHEKEQVNDNENKRKSAVVLTQNVTEDTEAISLGTDRLLTKKNLLAVNIKRPVTVAQVTCKGQTCWDPSILEISKDEVDIFTDPLSSASRNISSYMPTLIQKKIIDKAERKFTQIIQKHKKTYEKEKLNEISRFKNSILTAKCTQIPFQHDFSNISDTLNDNKEEDNGINKISCKKYCRKEGKSDFFEIYKDIKSQPYCFEVNKIEVTDIQNSAIVEKSNLSPRIEFASSCMTNHLPPLSILVTPFRRKISTHQEGRRTGSVTADVKPNRKSTSSSIENNDIFIQTHHSHTYNFAYQSLGDDYMIMFANSLNNIPYVTSLNLRSNRLSDKGLSAVLLAISSMSSLLVLDISCNEIGDKSAELLRKYIGGTFCTLKKLYLSEADIEDDEAASFMTSFENNKTITDLCMSHNRIGEKEELNVVQPDFTTGGEAIASMLNTNLCILKLDISWNLIRLSSAITLAESLSLNYNLQELNISYNACGDNGAMAFGQSLYSNRSLKSLDLSYNNIGAKGTMVLANALMKNKSLRVLHLNGNNVGKDGGGALMYTVVQREDDNPIEIGLESCNLSTISTDVFNPLEPTGEYDLDLSVPYDYMIAVELLRLATHKKGCYFLSIEYKNSRNEDDHLNESSGVYRPIILKHSHVEHALGPLDLMFKDIDKHGSGNIDVKELMQVLHSLHMFPSEKMVAQFVKEYTNGSNAISEKEFREGFIYKMIFSLIDKDASKTIDKEELSQGLSLLGLPSTSTEVENIFSIYDSDHSNEIDESEFIEFLQSRATSICNEKRSIEEYSRRALVEISSGEVWKIPQTGNLRVDFLQERNAPSSQPTLSNSNMERLIQNIKNSGRTEKESSAVLSAALENSQITLTAENAIYLLRECLTLSNKDIVVYVADILPQMISSTEANRFISGSLTVTQRIKLKRRLGPCFSPITGNLTRHYEIDLAKPQCYLAAIKIAEIANLEKEFSKNHSNRADTSQHGNWENFRNSTYNGRPIILTGSFFTNLQHSGILEFDYISTARPKKGTGYTSDRRFITMLLSLAKEYEKEINQKTISEIENQYQEGQRKQLNHRTTLNDYDDFVLFEKIPPLEDLEIMLDIMEIIFTERYISCAQLKFIASRIPDIGDAIGRSIQMLFSHVIDLEYFCRDVFDMLPEPSKKYVVRCLGWLNIMNPIYAERHYFLDLSVREDREIAKVLIKLAVDEPGENWIDQSYSPIIGDPPIPGWELPISWATEPPSRENRKTENSDFLRKRAVVGGSLPTPPITDGGPRRCGALTLTYYSGTDKGCSPLWGLREELKEFFLLGTKPLSSVATQAY